MSSLNFNHIAITTKNPEMLAGFYTGILGLKQIRKNLNPDGGIRSIWLSLNPGTILMLEKTDTTERSGQGFYLAAFHVSEREKEDWRNLLLGHKIAIYNETEYTIYFSDPDGNRLAFSSFPREIS